MMVISSSYLQLDTLSACGRKPTFLVLSDACQIKSKLVQKTPKDSEPRQSRL